MEGEDGLFIGRTADTAHVGLAVDARTVVRRAAIGRAKIAERPEGRRPINNQAQNYATEGLHGTMAAYECSVGRQGPRPSDCKGREEVAVRLALAPGFSSATLCLLPSRRGTFYY